MAYVRNSPLKQEDELVENPTSPFITHPAGGSSARELTGGVAAPNQQNANTGSFTNLRRYLSANETGANNLGDKVSSDINQAKTAAETGIATETGKFDRRISEGTNVFNEDLVGKAAKDASSYVNDPTLGKQLSGTYAGPSMFAGSGEEAAASKGLLAAQDKGNLAGSAGGRTQLLSNVLKTPTGPQTTSGGQNLNQFLLQNTEPAYNKVVTEAKAITPLAESYLNTANTLQGNIGKATQTSLDTKQKALATLTQGTTDLQTQIKDALTAKQAEVNAADRDAPIKQYLSGLTSNAPQAMTMSAGPDPQQILSNLGLTQSQIDSFIASNEQAKSVGQPGVNLAEYLSGSTPDILGTADVATSEQKEDLGALAQLLGTNNNFLQSGTKGTGPQLNLSGATGTLGNQYNTGFANKQAADKAIADKDFLDKLAALIAEGQKQSETGPGTVPDAVIDTTSPPVEPTAPVDVGGIAGDYGGGGPGNASPGAPGAGLAGGSTTVGGGLTEGMTTGLNVAGSVLGSPVGLLGSVVNSLSSPTTPSSVPNAPSQGVPGFAAGEGPSAAAPGSPGTTSEGNSGIGGNASATGNSSVGEGGGTTGIGGSGPGSGVGAGEGGTSGGSSGSSGAAPSGGGEATGTGAPGDGSAGGGGGAGKIICTLMNDFYGLPYTENKVWIKYATTHLQPEHQKGYHKVFLPLVAYAKKPGYINNKVRDMLFYIGKHRTIDIQAELAGTYRRPVHKFLRAVIEPTLYWIGRITK